MPGDHLPLESFEIRSFRAFRHLRVDRLGRVNLITGKNNVGKSCFLEALWLYTSLGSPTEIVRLLRMRDEVRFDSRRSDVGRGGQREAQQLLNVRFLFHGRSSIMEATDPIGLGPVDSPNRLLRVSVSWATRLTLESGRSELHVLEGDDYRTAEDARLVVVTTFGPQVPQVRPLEAYSRPFWSPEAPVAASGLFVPANGLDMSMIALLWDSITLSELEDDVLQALRIISPEIERVSLVADPASSRERIPVVKLTGQDMPMPLRSLGEGMNRLFGVALAVVNARNGVLLIDEIESGLHYSVQTDLWRMIFALTQRLRIQVFATTHSWDCVSAFQDAAPQAADAAMLIRLGKREDAITASLFDQDDLAIATRERIEVR